MSEYKSTCSFCNKEYDSYMRNYFVQFEENTATKREACPECWRRFGKVTKYRFTNHIPAFCDGGELVTMMYEDKDKLIDYLNRRYKNDTNIICMDKNSGNIVTVSTDKKYWWMYGYSNLDAGDLPHWKDKVIELYGEI